MECLRNFGTAHIAFGLMLTTVWSCVADMAFMQKALRMLAFIAHCSESAALNDLTRALRSNRPLAGPSYRTHGATAHDLLDDALKSLALDPPKTWKSSISASHAVISRRCSGGPWER